MGSLAMFPFEDPQRDERYEAVLEWLSQPKDRRTPATLSGLARKLDVPVSALSKLLRYPPLSEHFLARVRAQMMAEDVPAVLRTMVGIASDPDHPRNTQAAKIVLDWVHRAAEARPPVFEDVQSLSDEELRKRLSQLVDELDDRLDPPPTIEPLP